MTMPANFNIREVWYQEMGATFPTAFTAASDASWTGSGVKLRTYDRELTDIKHSSVPDPATQDTFHGHPANIATLNGGTDLMAFKFKMHLGGGSATTDATSLTTLMGAVMGGINSPAAISDAAEAACTTTQVNATAHGLIINEAVLVGVRGDGYGDGRVGVIASKATDNYTLRMALPGAPQTSAVLKNGHSMWVDPTTESYQDFLLIGHYAGSGATDYPDILNLSGCSGTLMFGGFGAGETPYVEFTFLIGQWRWEPYASTKALDPTTAMAGSDPAALQAMGAFTFGDAADTARAALSGGQYEVDPGMALVPILDRNGVNGIGGWARTRGIPTMKLTRYFGDIPGLYNDFTGGTAKQVTLQIGHTAQNTVVFHMQKAYLDEDPHPVELEQNMGLSVMLHGTTGGATDLATAAKRLQDAPLTIYQL